MKKIFSLSLVTVAGLVLVPAAWAAPLPVGTTPVVPSPVASFDGTQVDSFTFDFSNAAETGSVVENIYDDNGSLDFYYQVTDNAGSTDGLSRLTVGNFTGYTTDVDYVSNTGSSGGAAADLAPTSVTRYTADTVGFNFYVAPGQASDWLEVATNATSRAAGSIAVIDGSTSSSDQAVGPETVPEPSTWALILASAAGGLINLVRRQR